MVKPDAETQLAHSIEEAEHVIGEGEPPDTILLDLRLPDSDGLSGLGSHKLARGNDWIISAEEIRSHARRIRQGARATDQGRLTSSRGLARARTVLFRPRSQRPATPPALHLTDREEEVVRALALGRVNKQLADMLGVSESTFKTHLRAIYRKLGVRTRLQAAGRARELGLLPVRRRA